jgi:hypothetical protein
MSATPHLLTAEEILARIFAADPATVMRAVHYSGASLNRPLGLQLLSSLSVQDATRALGQGIPPGLAQYTLGR